LKLLKNHSDLIGSKFICLDFTRNFDGETEQKHDKVSKYGRRQRLNIWCSEYDARTTGNVEFWSQKCTLSSHGA